MYLLTLIAWAGTYLDKIDKNIFKLPTYILNFLHIF